MRKQILLGLSLAAISFWGGQKLLAEETDLTHLIVNNDFEYVAEGVPHIWDTWKPKDTGTNQGYTQFYGWKCDLDVLGGSSQGINKDFNGTQHGTYGCWIASARVVFPENWELYQTIEGLDAGIYKVQCLLSPTKKPTTQRLFANNDVQYCHSEADYAANKVEGENATFANYPVRQSTDADSNLDEMVVYTTIEQGEALKIGIRTGNKKGNGDLGPADANPAWGWFKVDYFRLTKVDRIPTGLNNPELKVDYFINNGTLTVNGVDAYTVYNISGAKIAEVSDAANMSVPLNKGAYIVRANNSEAFKILVK